MRLLLVMVVAIAVTMADSGYQTAVATAGSLGTRQVAARSSVVTSSMVGSSAPRPVRRPVRRAGYGPVAVFNNPRGPAGQRSAISGHIRRLIRGAPRGSYIQSSVFHFNSGSLAGELVRARRRGVNVQLVLDSDSMRYPVYRVLRRGLGANMRSRSWLTVCGRGRGCIAPGAPGRPGINHNKYILFSRTSGHRNVVLQTSANMTGTAERGQWNNAVSLADPTIYAGYLQYFWDQARQRSNPDYRRMVVSGHYAVQFFPRVRDDPVLAALNAVACTRGTRVRTVVGYLTWMPVVQRLRALAAAGCSVEIVTSGISVSAARELTRPGPAGRVPLVRYTPEVRRAVVAHSKYLTIEGGYMGKQRRVVFTGSVNFTTPGFRRNDEALLTVADNAGIHQAYARNFGTVWRSARWLRAASITPRSGARYARGLLPHPLVPDDFVERD